MKQTNEKATSPEGAATPISPRMYRMACDKCGAAVRTNDLSHRVKRCSCIGCGGTLFYADDAEFSSLRDQLSTALKERDEAVEREEKYKAALEHYADRSNWACEGCGGGGCGCNKDWYHIGGNGYNLAEVALSEGKEKDS